MGSLENKEKIKKEKQEKKQKPNKEPKEKAPIIKNNWFMIKHLYKASKLRFWSLMIETVFGNVFGAICDVYLLKVIFDYIEQGREFIEIIPLFLLIALFSLARRFFNGYYWWYICHLTDQSIFEYMNSLMFKKAIIADLDCYEDSEFFNKYTVASKDIFGRSTYILASVCDMVGKIASLTTILSIMATIDLKLAAIALIPVVLTFPLSLMNAKLWPKFDKEAAPYRRKADYVQRTVYLNQYAKEYRLSNIFNIMKDRFINAKDDLKSVETKFQTKAAILFIIWGLFSWMFLSVVAPVFVAYQVLFTTGFTIGSFMATLNALPRLSYGTSNLINQFATFKEHALFVKNILTFYELEPKIKQNERGLLPHELSNEIELKNVTFTYKGQTEPVLKNINMKIKAGEKVAFVGHNGAGKSTLVKLIMQLYQPDSGEILLNGEPINKYNLRAYYDMFGTIFQDFQMYALTVAENVLLREVKTEEDRQKVVESLKLSGGYEKVMSFEKGIDAILTREFDEEGIALSGGENQKIAIARVFANEAPVIILDEPSSALDPIAEYKIYESIKSVSVNKTVMFISHRLSSTKMADNIYMFEKGEIIEQGSHSDLMSFDGKYADMFNKQAENYVKKTPVNSNVGGGNYEYE